MLGNISQPRISQLVRSGDLVAEKDDEGRLRIDRQSVERRAVALAQKNAIDPNEAEEKRMLQEEARDRLKRERKRDEQEKRERREHLDRLHERSVEALEAIAFALQHPNYPRRDL